MKKVLLLTVFAMGISIAHAGTITWGSVLDAGLQAEFSSGWLVAMYKDTNNDGFNDIADLNQFFTTGVTGTDDVLLGLTDAISSGKSGTGWGTSFGSPNAELSLGNGIISVVINSSAFGAGVTKAWYSSSFSGGLSANAGGQAVLPATDIDASYVVTDMEVIPEPGTIGMMGIAGLGMYLARRKNRR